MRLGKQDINSEFKLIEMAGDFIQSSFGLSPSAALPSYPNQSAAALLIAQLTSDVRIKAGVWDTFAKPGDWGFSGNEAHLYIAELETRYHLAQGRLAGSIEAGAVYFSGGSLDGLELNCF